MTAWADEGRPILLLEDLSSGLWPEGAKWTPGRIQDVLSVLRTLHKMPPPTGLGPVSAQGRYLKCWHRIASEPHPFLELGLCSSSWLQRSLRLLLAAEDAARLEGESFIHGDVQSGNICFRGTRCSLIDWNWAGVGNPAIDLIRFALSACRMENKLPESIIPGQGELLALFAGHTACHAGLPPPPQAPSLRVAQRHVLGVLLPWTARVLGLPAPADSVA
jgi:aminoglycoside phosphotransferase (APT) family kinase protein